MDPKLINISRYVNCREKHATSEPQSDTFDGPEGIFLSYS